MLEVRNLNVWYGITEVLRDVSFEAPAGRVTVLLGGNGSGKTTVLNTLSGLVTARSGSLRIADREFTGLSTDRVVRLGIVQVPQGREVFATMTVRANLELGASTRDDKAAIRADIEEWFAMFPALRERRSHRASTLSGGQQQQLAIARALMARPRLLLMDEPSAGLSPIVIQEVINIIKRLRDDRGLTILLVEQNVGVAAAVGDMAHVLQNGEIAYRGPASELIANPEVLASYLGR
jgi:branched-chain amino acid transport system ATP-binding protein